MNIEKDTDFGVQWCSGLSIRLSAERFQVQILLQPFFFKSGIRNSLCAIVAM